MFIRLTYSNENGFVCCYTCDKIEHWKSLQNGHFVSRSKLATRYDEKNCRPQCSGCNLYGNGRPDVFGIKLTKEYGEGIVTGLYRQGQEVVRYFPYQEKIDYYKIKVKELLAQKHL